MTKEFVDIVIKELLVLGFNKVTTEKGVKRNAFYMYHKGYQIEIRFQKAYESFWDAYVVYEIGTIMPVKVIETVWDVNSEMLLKRSEQLNEMFNFLER